MNKNNKNFLWDKLFKTLKVTNCNYKLLKNTKFLITGGTGFVGSWIIHSLAVLNKYYYLNMEILIITNNPKNMNKYFFLSKQININYVLNKIESLEYLDGNFTHLIHCCGIYKGSRNRINLVNNIGTKNIIKIAKKNKIKNLIYISSGAVYESTKEEKKLNELNIKINKKSNDYYSLSKKQGEDDFIKLFQKNNNLNLSILRLFSFIGPGTSTLKYLAYTAAINSRYKNKTIKLLSNGLSTRSYMHPIDLACWIIKSLFYKNLNIINVGSDKELKILDMAKKVSNLKFKNYKKVELEYSEKSDGNTYYVPSLKKAFNKRNKLFTFSWNNNW